MGDAQRTTATTARDRGRRLPPRGPDGRFVAIRTDGDGAVDLSDPSLYINRELSWLEFNRRVLALAGDASLPLLERLRHIAIFHSNLDEFFMIRVAGLRSQVQAGVTAPTPDGRSPDEQLAAIASRLKPMLASATTVLHDQLFRLLRRHGVAVVTMADLDNEQRKEAAAYFDERVYPVLTPLAVDPGHPFPYISNLSVSLAVTIWDRRRELTRFARIKVPKVLPRFIELAGDGEQVFVPLEDLIRAHIDQLFPGVRVVAAHAFRVTRNADLEIEDNADDLMVAIEDKLRTRRFGAVVRLEVDSAVPDHVTALLQGELGVSDRDTYRVTGLLGGDDLVQLADLEHRRLRFRPWHPVPPWRLRPSATGRERDIFAELRDADLLVHHPYEAFGASVEQFVVQAADDPDVLAIKQTMYRTSGDSAIVKALIHAAERGKQVVALVELLARFDEQANIVWARELESAGVHVVYGVVGLKTHAKTTLVVRREQDGIRSYVHIGTGNYNPRTARYYTDVGLLSCDPALAADLTELFNAVTGYAREKRYRKIVVAPWRMRAYIIELIEREASIHASGARSGSIRMTANALIDEEIIAALYRASRVGVPIRMVIRGICGLRPGVQGISETIEVTSILGRFLEHTRILQFGPDDIFIGSADLMQRNLDRRVEALTPVEDPTARARLCEIIDVMVADNCASWRLSPGGSWLRQRPDPGEPRRHSQEELMMLARERADALTGR